MKETIDENKVIGHPHDASFNEKRKWQIALRRYVINKSKSIAYAPYFGLDIEGFRNWIESQFDDTMNWDNFSEAWQFEHVIPVIYFDLNDEAELKLCWSFLNIRAEKLNSTYKTHKPDVHGATFYFEALYNHTGLQLCSQMVKKIESIQLQKILPKPTQLLYLKEKANDVQIIANFSAYEFERLNNGDNIVTLIAEQELIKRFG
jgi:ribosomal protein L28